MSIEKAYNTWVDQYDTNHNKTRDLDQKATIETLSKYNFTTVLELGCGTGKNTAWLVTKAEKILCLDFSQGMLDKAEQKIKDPKIIFKKTDLNQKWDVPDEYANLVTSSLVLEHIQDLDRVFAQAHQKLKSGGKYFISELHPFKQYAGSKARFETKEGIQELEAYVHHISEYTSWAIHNGFKLIELKEWFDGDDTNAIPRLITFVFEK